MGKEKKHSVWSALLRGGSVSLLLYLLGVFLLALLMIKGFLPEDADVAMIAGLGLCSAVIGGKLAVGWSSMASVPTAVLNAMFFLLLLILVGGIGWSEALRSGESVICGSSVLAGGLLAGVMGTRGGQRRKRKRSRAGKK